MSEALGRIRGALYLVVALGCASILATACGGGSSGDGAGGAGGNNAGHGGNTSTVTGSPLDELDFAAKYAAAICDNVGACCKRANRAAPQTGCLTTIANSLSQQLAEHRKNLDYDRVAAGNCVAQVSAGVKACDADAERNAKACSDVYRGKLVPGTECDASIECAPPSGLLAACLDVCTVFTPPPPAAKEGESCVTADGRLGACQDGLECDSAGKCTTRGVAVGGDCSFSSCKPGLTCDEFGFTCRAGAKGGYCYGGLGCAEDSHFCDTCTLTCTPKLADGKPCQRFDQCASGHCNGGSCTPELYGAAKLCGEELEPPPPAPRSCATDPEPTGDFTWGDPVSIGSLGIVTKVWGTAADDIYAATAQGELFHSTDGSAWAPVTIPGGTYVAGIWGLTANEIYAVSPQMPAT